MFTGIFTAVGFIITLVFIRVQPIIELIGFMSLLIEAMLGVPQFFRNYQNKSTEGMR